MGPFGVSMRRLDDDVAVFNGPAACLAPFEIGDLVLAGRFEDAVAGVPVGLQRDVVEMAMRQASESRPAHDWRI